MSHNLFAVQVFDRCQVHPAFIGPNIGNIADLRSTAPQESFRYWVLPRQTAVLANLDKQAYYDLSQW